ncbi:MAG: hypothetical protein Q3986_05425 [Akkermansia sp.]|nr:hypothetical protein [Akkermansia sp.]
MSIPVPIDPLGTLGMDKSFQQPFMTGWTTYTLSAAPVSMVLNEQESSGYRQDAMPWMAFGGGRWGGEKAYQESLAVIEFGHVLTIEKVSLHCNARGSFRVEIWDGSNWIEKIRRTTLESGKDYTFDIGSDLQKIRFGISAGGGVTVISDVKFTGQIKA